MKTLRACILLSLALAWVRPALAAPTLYGATGLIRMPTAFTLNRGEVDAAIALHNVDLDSGNSLRFINESIVAGLCDSPEHGAEIGIHHLSVDGRAGTGTAITGKYRFPGILPLGAFAVGGRLNLDGAAQNTAYVVGSTNAARTFAVHYGAGINFHNATGQFSLMGGKDDAFTNDRLYAMFGGELDLGDDFKLNVDYNGDTVGYGLDWFPVESVVASVYYLGNGDSERLVAGSQKVGVGVAIQF